MVRFRRKNTPGTTSPPPSSSTSLRKNNDKKSTSANYFLTNVLFLTCSIFLITIASAVLSRHKQAKHNESSNVISSLRNKKSNTKLNFVTVVMPSVVNPSRRKRRLDSILSTWGPKSNAIYVLHNISHFDNNLSSSEYPKPLLAPSQITNEMGVVRLQHVIQTISKQYNPDFAFFVNDHTYVIPEHLCSFLRHRNPDEGLYAGHAMKNEKEDFMFNSGAAGYVLSRKTMLDLVQKWNEKDVLCTPDETNSWLQGNPGLVTAKCATESLDTPPIDTRDKTNGGHIFHAYGIVRTTLGKVDNWYINKHKNIDPKEDIKALLPFGERCCSPKTVSFHYVEYAETLSLFELINKVATAVSEGNPMKDEEIKKVMMDIWPKNFKDLGGYSRGLPKEKDKVWKDLIQVVRKISPENECGY